MAEGNGNWKDGFPDEIKNHPSMENLDGVEALAKSWVGAQKLIGKEKLPVPTGPEDKDAWQTVFTRLGRPETAEGYEIDKNNIPAEVPVDENFLKTFKELSHTLGFNPTQVQGLFNWWIGAEKGIITQMQETDQTTKQAAETRLRQEWGKAYEQNVKLASTIITKFGGKDIQELLSSPFGNDPKVVKLLAAVGKTLSEEDLLEGEGVTTHTPAEAQIEISRIMGDSKHPYFHAEHPEHKAAVEYMQSLHKMVYPEGSK
jgi:hypothetical protein